MYQFKRTTLFLKDCLGLTPIDRLCYADSAVAVTAGSGTSIDTRTEATNGNHRAVVVLGDPSINAGVAPVDATAGLKVDLGADNDITGTVTANLGATDNQVLDDISADTGSILADTTAILADTAAIEIATEAAQAALETVGGLVVNLGANNDVTVTGTVDLGATDNGVLDTIDGVLDTINAKLVTGTDIGDVTINNSTGAAAVNIQDGGNTITVDGTVTADLGAVDNAVLDDIAAKLATIDADTSALAAGVSTEYQVDVVGALPAGTNAIGKLAANSGVDIGDVTLTAGTAAIGTLLPPDIDITAHTNYARKYYTSAGAATDGIVWSPAAGKRWHIVALHFQVSAAATVTFEDDKAGGDDPVLKGEYPANGGEFLVFPEKYPMASGEDAADLLVTTSAGNIYITAVGYEI